MLIMELIKRGRCICGQEIRDGNEAYQHLMAELAYVPPESIGNTVRHYKERLSSFSRPAERTYSSLDERYRAILRSKNRIQEWEDAVTPIITGGKYELISARYGKYAALVFMSCLSMARK